MLKVKKRIQNPKIQNNNELTDLQNQTNNSTKNLFIKDQKNKKTNGYADLVTKIRNEYAQLQKENNQLKIELQNYQQYVQNVSQNPYRKPSYVRPKRKRILQYYDESGESDSYISEVRKRPRKSQKRKIIYENNIDGIPYRPDSPTEEEDEEDGI